MLGGTVGRSSGRMNSAEKIVDELIKQGAKENKALGALRPYLLKIAQREGLGAVEALVAAVPPMPPEVAGAALIAKVAEYSATNKVSRLDAWGPVLMANADLATIAAKIKG